MDIEVKSEPIDNDRDTMESIIESDIKDQIESIPEGNIKQEKELVIESDWLPTKYEDEESEYYQEFVEECSQNMSREIVVKNDSDCEQYTIEYLHESEESDDDYEDDEHDSGLMENYLAELESPKAMGELDSLESKSLYQLQLKKWIVNNYIKRKCPICNEKFTYYRGLQNHVILNHKESIEDSESNYYFSRDNCGVCKECNQEFFTKYSRYIHSKKHNELDSKSYIYICKICNFNSKRVSVQNHIVKMHPEILKEFKPSNSTDNIRCPLCSTTYVKRLHLCYHFMDKHPHEYKAMFKYKCPLCKNGVFDDKDIFLQHLINDHLLNSWDMLNYRKVFEDKDYFACVKCNSLFFQNDTCKLLNHFLQHEAKFGWSCNFCCKKLNFKTSPFSHMCVKMMRYYETRNDNGEFLKRNEFKIKSLREFEEHIAHICPFCNKEFDKMIRWQQHMRSDHVIDTLKGLQMKVVDDDSKKLRCLICCIVVPNVPQQIQAHSFQHLTYKPYKCLLCSKILNTFKMATDHVFKRCRDDDSRYDIRAILKIQCSVCNFENIDDPKSVFKHYENEHNYFEDFFIKDSNTSTMTCKICFKKYVHKEKITCFEHLHNHFDEKTFKCKLCLKSYPTYKTMSEHLLQFHNAKPLNKQSIDSETDNTSDSFVSNTRNFSNVGELAKFVSYICPECNECMTSKANWDIHIKTHHSFFAESNLYIKAADGSLKCPACSITLSSKKFYQRKHKLTHMPHRSFMCNLCYDRSISLDGIYMHFRRKHFAQGTFECSICSAILETEYQRTEHLKKMHTREEWPACVCLICYKVLANKLCLHRHMKTHKADRFRHTCEICGTRILELRDLNIHMNRHKLRGEIIEKTSSNLNDYNNIDFVTESVTDYKSNIKKWHVLHEFEEFVSYVCPDCNEGMTTQHHWHRHIRTQHNFFDESNLYIKDADGLLKCPTCGIALPNAVYKQQRHKLSHLPYKSFMCNLCFDRCSSLDGLYIHFRRAHFAQGTFDCPIPICSDVLQNEYQRSEHIKKIHTTKEWPNNMCSVCYKTFANKRLLSHHMDTHTKDSCSYSCEICGAKVLKLEDFNAHMDRHKTRCEIKDKISDDIELQSVFESHQLSDTNDAADETEHTNTAEQLNFSNKFEKLPSVENKTQFIDDNSSQCSSQNGQSIETNRVEVFNESETEFISCDIKKEMVRDISLQCGSASIHSADTNATDSKEKVLNVREEFDEFITYACPVCNEAMTTYEEWNSHIRTQHNLFDESSLYIKEAGGSLKCPTCRITLDTRPYPQQRHKLTHLPYKSFICNLCYDRCNSLTGLYVHFRRKHFAQGTFECPICKNVLQNMHQRAEHIKNIHPRKDWPDTMCSICYKIYPNKMRLKHHMVTHNANRFKYTCDICGSKICDVRNFKVHMDNHKIKGETNVKLVNNSKSINKSTDIVPESQHINKRKSIRKVSGIKRKKLDPK